MAKVTKDKLNVRDYITTAILTVLIYVVFFVMGMPLGSTPIGWIFTLAACAIPWGIIFMLLFTKVNKKGTALLVGVVLGLLQAMNFWAVALIMVVAALISEVVWRKLDRKKFSTMLLSYSIIVVGWFCGAFVPLIFLKDLYLKALPAYYDFYSSVFDVIAGPFFFVALVVTIVACVIGAFLGKALLKKHFERAGVV